MRHADPCRACSLVVVWLNSLDMLAASQLLGRLEHDFEPLDKLGCAFWAQHGLPLITRYKSVLACRRRVEGLSECKLVLHLHFPLESVLRIFSHVNSGDLHLQVYSNDYVSFVCHFFK